MSNEMDMFKDLYLQSAREHIQILNNTLLKIESKPDQLDLVEELMREGHSLKGESAAMGFEQMATLAHVVEDLFTGIGNGQMKITNELMDVLFSAFDHFSASLDNIAGKAGTELNCEQYVAQIKKLTGLKTEGFGKSASKAAEAVAAETTTPKAAATKVPVDKAEAATKIPTDPEVPTANSEVPTPEAPTPTPDAAAPTPDAPSTATDQISTITLKVEKLDQMISVSEELVLLKMQLKTNPIVLSDTHLKAEIHRLDRLVTDLQFHVMQARLFPISLALTTIPRLARDTAHKCGKQVRLEIEGDDTTVDRSIIDHMTEPFVHMVRNSIDHGIEDPDIRAQTGKPTEAVVKIKAYTKENKFFVEVSDDGRGIEWDKLAKSAVKKGMVTEEQMVGWTEKDYEKLLFMEGVSASEVVTDISGRGVGLDAVYRNIKKLGGSIHIQTKPGEGTTFTMRLPMTLAIMQALLIQVGPQVFALPGNEVIRSISIKKTNIRSAGNAAVIALNNEDIPLYDLKELFSIPKNDSQDVVIVLMRLEQKVIGCIVDKILAEEEVLIKQLGTLLKKNPAFSGATILANGTAAPIINIEGLITA